jgi:hypothetical protein
MNSGLHTATTIGTKGSTIARQFAQDLLGESATTPGSSEERPSDQAHREQLAWLASISTKHQREQRRSSTGTSSATAERAHWEWLAEISSRHCGQPERPIRSGAKATEGQSGLAKFLEDLQEGPWDPAKHPRRGGAPNAGWFARTGASDKEPVSDSVSKHVPIQQVAWPGGIGHHWAPVSVIFDPG